MCFRAREEPYHAAACVTSDPCFRSTGSVGISHQHMAAHSDVSFFFGALTKLLVLLTLIGFMCDKEKRDEFMIMSATHFPLPLQPVAVTGSRRRFSLKRCLLFGK